MKRPFVGMTFVVLIAIAIGCGPHHQVELPRDPAPPPEEQDPRAIEKAKHETTTFPLTDRKATETE